jgi:hypothetical protein
MKKYLLLITVLLYLGFALNFFGETQINSFRFWSIFVPISILLTIDKHLKNAFN